MPKKSKKRSSKIEDLPEPDTESTPDELEMLQSLLNVKTSNPAEYSKLKFVFFASFLFAMLNLPFTDRLIELASPAASSWLVLLVIKTMIFFLMYYVVVYSATQ